MTKKFKQGFIKSNAYKTRWFVIWHVELTEDEILAGLGEKPFNKAFNTEEEAKEFFNSLKNI